METPVNGSPSPEENTPKVRVQILAGDSLEIAADLITRLHLSPRDHITLATGLLCAVVDLGNLRFPNSSPFRHIPLPEGENANPFTTAIAVLQEVDSWGNGGAEIPEHLRMDE